MQIYETKNFKSMNWNDERIKKSKKFIKNPLLFINVCIQYKKKKYVEKQKKML